jgi:hypothetical protein
MFFDYVGIKKYMLCDTLNITSVINIIFISNIYIYRLSMF